MMNEKPSKLLEQGMSFEGVKQECAALTPLDLTRSEAEKLLHLGINPCNIGKLFNYKGSGTIYVKLDKWGLNKSNDKTDHAATDKHVEPVVVSDPVPEIQPIVPENDVIVPQTGPKDPPIDDFVPECGGSSAPEPYCKTERVLKILETINSGIPTTAALVSLSGEGNEISKTLHRLGIFTDDIDCLIKKWAELGDKRLDFAIGYLITKLSDQKAG